MFTHFYRECVAENFLVLQQNLLFLLWPASVSAFFALMSKRANLANRNIRMAEIK